MCCSFLHFRFCAAIVLLPLCDYIITVACVCLRKSTWIVKIIACVFVRYWSRTCGALLTFSSAIRERETTKTLVLCPLLVVVGYRRSFSQATLRHTSLLIVPSSAYVLQVCWHIGCLPLLATSTQEGVGKILQRITYFLAFLSTLVDVAINIDHSWDHSWWRLITTGMELTTTLINVDWIKCNGEYRSMFLTFIYADTIGTEVVCNAINMMKTGRHFHLSVMNVIIIGNERYYYW